MKKIVISILSATFLFSISCNDGDFLDVKSQEKVESEDDDTVFEPEMFINAIYGMFTDWQYGFAYLGVTEIISDNADKGSTPLDTGTDKEQMDNLTYTVTTDSFKSLWQHWYTSIGRATLAMEYTENYGLTNETYKNRLIGEAKFLRALNYFFLVRGWGAIPIQEENLEVRASVEDVYAYIERDLLDAISVLPVRSGYDDKDLGRATKGAAQGLLAKVYLYQKKWQEAYTMANNVLTSGEYSLLTNYEWIWRADYRNSSESLFEFQARGETIAHGVQQYSQTQGARGGNGWGWGFNTPTEDLLNAYNAEGDEIRRDATIMFRNQTLWDDYNIGATDNPMYNYKAYSSANKGADDTDKSIRYLRLGEIYLIKAEAANELNNTTAALDALNEVRSRVNLPDVSETNQSALRQAIWKERRLELAFEHDRWFDLVRTGQAASVMQAHGKPFVAGKHELFPIPEQQTVDTPNIEQNPGW